jgi:hypothetical protein
MTNHIKLTTALLPAVLLILCISFSCKTPEKIPELKLQPMSAVRLFKKAKDNTFDYRSFQIKRINIQYDNGKIRTTFRASVHAVKDQAVLLSVTKLNILLAKVMLTPDSVVYVNYFDKSFYRGDYEAFNSLLQYELNFNTIQAIVSANIFSLFDNEKELREFKTWNEQGLYVLQSETVRKLTRLEEKGKLQKAERFLKRKDEKITVIQTFYFDPKLFTIRKVEMKDKDSPREAILYFSDYESVGDKYYPASVDLIFRSDGTAIEVNSKISGFSTVDGEFVPLKIPEKYERVFLNSEHEN